MGGTKEGWEKGKEGLVRRQSEEIAEGQEKEMRGSREGKAW